MANRPRSTRAATAAKASQQTESESLSFSVVNAALGVAGIVALAAGYWFLANGSITAAPLLLVLGYVVLLPLAVIL
jgi:hypothetical protein